MSHFNYLINNGFKLEASKLEKDNFYNNHIVCLLHKFAVSSCGRLAWFEAFCSVLTYLLHNQQFFFQ